MKEKNLEFINESRLEVLVKAVLSSKKTPVLLLEDQRLRVVDLHAAERVKKSISKSFSAHQYTERQPVYKKKKFGCWLSCKDDRAQNSQ